MEVRRDPDCQAEFLRTVEEAVAEKRPRCLWRRECRRNESRSVVADDDDDDDDTIQQPPPPPPPRGAACGPVGAARSDDARSPFKQSNSLERAACTPRTTDDG
ncbi:unnamed protein product [Heligmosomoides polygyrus]|uniref:Uncharacterized protein n=1 Tax=Heligmosomoides polygyrus TaxID=6339 RepID=A0A183GA18_HELPZ|nr:unnamed protein product [Heligmosomoides polygyrus]